MLRQFRRHLRCAEGFGRDVGRLTAELRRVASRARPRPGGRDAVTFSASKTSFLAQSPNYAAYENQQPFGSSFALLDLGLPSSGTVSITSKLQYDNWYFAYFLQDDWKTTSTLTFSLGLRLDHETALVESNNRMVQTWNGSQPNTTSSTASAAYASQYSANVAALAGYNPSYLPSASALNTNGATVYETPGNRDPYHPATVYVSPRIGFAYAPARFNNKLVVRGGFSICESTVWCYYLPPQRHDRVHASDQHGGNKQQRGRRLSGYCFI